MSVSSELPEWLCQTSLQKILDGKLKRSCDIVSVKSSKGSIAGDNYLSDIFRLSVKVRYGGKEEVIHLIIKDVSGGWSLLMDEVNAVEKEVEVYTEFIPFANRVIKEPVAAECYFVSPGNCLLLEDLSILGYRVASRKALLDFDHASVALRSLAHFHAASIKFLEDSPEGLRAARHNNIYLVGKDNITYSLHNHMIKTYVRGFKNIEEGKQFVPALENFQKGFWEELQKAASTNFSLSALNHGDCWLGNILFRYVNGRPVHCRFVDFQLARCSTPCNDLYRFISTSLQGEVRDNNFDQLLDDYLDNLNSTLKEIGSERSLSRTDFLRTMDATKVFGILYGLNMSIFSLTNEPLELEKVKDREEIIGGFQKFDPFKNVCQDEGIVKHVISLLKFYRSKNYI